MRVVSFLPALVVLTATFSASAQPVPSEVWASYKDGRAKAVIFPEPRALLIRAQEAERAGRRDEALDLYAQAFDLQPFPAVEAEYGLALVRMGKVVLGARHLQVAMKGGEFLDGVHTLEYVTDALSSAKNEIGTLVVETNEPGVRVTIDQEVVRDWPFYQEIFVEPGEHRVKATKPGFWMDEQTVKVEKGERKLLRVAMAMRVQSHILGMERPLNVKTEGYKEGPEARPTWPTKVIVVGGFGLALGTGLFAAGLVKTANAKTDDQVTTWENVSLVGAGIGSLGIGAIILGIAYRPEPPAPRVTITPSAVGRNGAGVMMGGVF